MRSWLSQKSNLLDLLHPYGQNICFHALPRLFIGSACPSQVFSSRRIYHGITSRIALVRGCIQAHTTSEQYYQSNIQMVGCLESKGEKAGLPPSVRLSYLAFKLSA